MQDIMHEVDAWEASVAVAIRRDPVWKLPAFRLASYALHMAWPDAAALARVPVMESVASQLYRAVGSVTANIAEGYSRSSGRDRARLYEYALGSARESVVWYRAATPTLGCAVGEARQALHQRIVIILLAAIPQERRRPLA